MLRRRDILHLGLAAALPWPALAAAKKIKAHPTLWLIERNDAKVYIFGFADAKDRSWLTPYIEKAFDSSDEVWFETPHPDPAAPADPRSRRLEDQLGNDPEHNLFDQLDAALSARLAAAAEKYGVPRSALDHTRPWMAYFVLNRGYRAKHGAVGESPDRVLSALAWAAKKRVSAEYPDRASLFHSFADTPFEVQCERLKLLLDQYDDEEAGRQADQYEWLSGRPPVRIFERMRLSYPALYAIDYVRRNEKWAERVDGLLAAGGTYFIAIGLNHTLGPDSMLVQIRKHGIQPQAT